MASKESMDEDAGEPEGDGDEGENASLEEANEDWPEVAEPRGTPKGKAKCAPKAKGKPGPKPAVKAKAKAAPKAKAKAKAAPKSKAKAKAAPKSKAKAKAAPKSRAKAKAAPKSKARVKDIEADPADVEWVLEYVNSFHGYLEETSSLETVKEQVRYYEPTFEATALDIYWSRRACGLTLYLPDGAKKSVANFDLRMPNLTVRQQLITIGTAQLLVPSSRA